MGARDTAGPGARTVAPEGPIGPRDEFSWMKCENYTEDINCNFTIKVSTIPTLSTGGCTILVMLRT